MNFKVGDRVVIVATPEQLEQVSFPRSIKNTVVLSVHVSTIKGSRFPEYLRVIDNWNIPTSYVVHEDVYNSPLYQAML
jgi:hypothetical protein